MFDPKLEQGSRIDNATLCDIFKCSTQGGMRRSHTTNTLVIVSNHIKSIYEDRWFDDVFHYTGMGMEGDQDLSFAQNRTLSESGSNGVSVHLFEVFEDKYYTYIGLVVLAGKPYVERQPDQNGNDRKVWMFPLKLKNQPPPVIPRKQLETLVESKEKEARKLSNEELQRRAQNAAKTPGSRDVVTTQLDRSVWVSEYAKRRAKGVCQLCGQKAPFLDLSGKPFLETHHIDWLSRGAEDTIENTVALCPNCHRKMHILDSKSDKEHLKKAARNRLED